MFFIPFVRAAVLFATFAAAIPRPDSAIGDEVAVSAPNGIVMSDTAELASQLGISTSPSASSSTSSVDASTTSSMMTDTATMTTSSMMSDSTTMMSSSTDSMATSSMMSSSTDSMMASMTPPPSYNTMSTTSTSSMSAPTYGSGSNSWGGSGYNNCIQQCVASFGAPAATYTPSPTYTGSSGNSGSGTTHTVIVAPTQGVLRYVPFAVNASVGDTVRFIWNANNHTVTKSSQLEICNKTSDNPFASGTQNKGFTFDQVVNDTNPTFFYCGTPTHCQKGMFGIINPPNAFGVNTSVGSMMSSLVSNNSDLSAMYSYTNAKTQGSYQASNWGQNIDMNSMPSWSYQYVAQNVMYARTFMAANPDVINSDGSINMNVNAPLVFPADLAAANNAAASGGSPASSTTASSGASTPSSTASSSSAPSASSSASASASNGATSTAVSNSLLAVAALAAVIVAL